MHCRTRQQKCPPDIAQRDASRHFYQRAFTLIELITVIVIIGILTALIIPEMRGTYEDALLRSTSRELISVFELASSRAVSLNQTHRVQFDTHSGKYFIERPVRDGLLEAFQPLTEVAGGTGKLDERITVEVRRPQEGPVLADAGREESVPVPEAVSFYPDGTADAVLISLQDRTGFRLGLKLNATTARVHVFELEHQ